MYDDPSYLPTLMSINKYHLIIIILICIISVRHGNNFTEVNVIKKSGYSKCPGKSNVKKTITQWYLPQNLPVGKNAVVAIAETNGS